MRILLSAYACEPGIGSEPQVGWDWALGMAGRHQVHVITREANREAVEQGLAEINGPKPSFSFYDPPHWLTFWKKGRRGVYPYYLLWQRGALRLARRLHRQEPFDLVHHVTFVTLILPTFMGRLGIPFILGPAAGGEYSPSRLWRGLGFRSILRETARFTLSRMACLSPLNRSGYARAVRILATSEQTRDLLPGRYRDKCGLMLQIGLSRDEVLQWPRPEPKGDGTFRILYAGRLLYWKGMEYGLRAFAGLLAQGADAELTLAGTGPDEGRWKAVARELGVADRVHWRGAVPREELMAEMGHYDCFLFPSLHDSGGMAVLEALAAKLPVVCLDVGGPGIVVDPSCGMKISLGRPDTVVQDLETALEALWRDPGLRGRLAAAGPARVLEAFTTEAMMERMDKYYTRAPASPDRAG